MSDKAVQVIAERLAMLYDGPERKHHDVAKEIVSTFVDYDPDRLLAKLEALVKKWDGTRSAILDDMDALIAEAKS